VVTGSIPIGSGSVGIAITEDGSRAYAVNHANSVSVINTATNSVISTIGVGANPLWIALLTPAAAPVDETGPLTSDVTVSPNPAAVNTAVSLAATVSDVQTGGSSIAAAVYSINGGPSAPLSLSNNTSSGPLTASGLLPPFSQAGVYMVCVHATDAQENVGVNACIPLPVYDPSAGFVTGGGSVASPAGADLVNTGALGKANFGFVSRYQDGAHTPSGNLSFHFTEGDLNFKSTSLDWLLVTGQTRAIFQGSGTINGAAACKFQVDAWAGSFTSGNSANVDAIGLKLYSCNGRADASGNRYRLEPTPLTGGRIMIHR
jgi:YVTN family beta-propeller protein